MNHIISDEDLQVQMECFGMVSAFFFVQCNQDPDKAIEKVKLWFNTVNPGLGDITPMAMIAHGRVNNLRRWIRDSMMGNIA